MNDAADMFAKADEPYDANNPLHVAEADLKAKRRQIEVREFISDVMSKALGRAWMHEMLDRCHMWSPSYMAGDPYGTSFREGERNIGLRLMAEIQDLTPENYVKMCREARTKK